MCALHALSREGPPRGASRHHEVQLGTAAGTNQVTEPAWSAETALAWVERWDAVMTGFWPWRSDVQQTVVDMLHRLGASGQVLELGCGPGSFAAQLAGRGSDVLAVDRDPLMVALARAHLAGRATVGEVDVTDAGWGARMDRRFDAVVTSAVLHMLDASRYAAAVREVAAVLRPHGVFVDVDEMPLAPCNGRLAATAAGLRESQTEAWFSSGHEGFAAWMEDLRRQPQSRPLLSMHASRSGARVGGRAASADERVAALRAVGFF